MPGDPIELGLVSLYFALDPDTFDLTQLGDETQVDVMSASPKVTLPDLTSAVLLSSRRDRYAANLAYVLAQRCLDIEVVDVVEETALLGQKILSRFDAPDLALAEVALSDAMQRMLDNPEITIDTAAQLVEAFGGSLAFTASPDETIITFTGPAAETATMFCELACMDFGISLNTIPGTVTVGHVDIEVFKFDHEFCTQAPFERTKAAVDPQYWHTYNPGFFRKVTVMTKQQIGTGADWVGVIQEEAGVLTNGTPLKTNLSISYIEQPGVAVTAYDLAPSTLPAPVIADDNNVTVDYGLFGVVDEGIHRRMRMVKVLHVNGFESVPAWVWKLWTMQLSMAGWFV